MVPNKLNPRQSLFCEYYTNPRFTPAEAVVAAGYSDRNPHQIASNLLRNPNVRERVDAIMAERLKKIRYDAEKVQSVLEDIVELDPIEIFDESLDLKPLDQWPPYWRKVISGIKISRKLDKDGEVIKGSTEILDIKMPEITKTIELLGKHVNINAFKKNVEVTTNDQTLKQIFNALNGNVTNLPEGNDNPDNHW